tara:strand:+ start:1011 stop:1760 length:750 start_codon:yes stop_codon:yes gene_type:complete
MQLYSKQIIMSEILKKLNVQIYADGADLGKIIELNNNDLVKGFTTNPSLMAKSGIKDYEKYSNEILSYIKDKPVSFEVFGDDDAEIVEQGEKISSWGKNVFVKVPIINSKGASTKNSIKKLISKNINLNITAIFTKDQVLNILDVINCESQVILSIFAGRIADAGVDPESIIREISNVTKNLDNVKILWASFRETYNIFQANRSNCHIITIDYAKFNKFDLIGKNLEEYSKETVQMFLNDATSSKFNIS